MDPELIVPVDVVGDADSRDIRKLGHESMDFVIANHVIEHLANPMAFVEDLFYVTKPGGLVVLSAPDKRFTYDSKRDVTSYDHLLLDYQRREIRPDNSHYMDFIVKVLPDGDKKTGQELEDLLDLVYRRREHVHVWDTDAFVEFLKRSLKSFGVVAEPIVELFGDDTKFEYFSIWKKGKPSFWTRLTSRFRPNAAGN
nr:methyltransferase domain-containing protein [Pelagicoccus albus]